MVKELEARGKEADIVVVGEKCQSQMWRTVGDHVTRGACAATNVVAPGSYTLASTLLT